MIGGVVGGVILFIVIAYVMRSCIRCFLKKKKMFEDIGDGLDEKIVLPLTERVVQSNPQNKDKYQPGAGQGNDQHNHQSFHSKNSLLKDLVKESNEGEGRGSDTTSGCESGQSSELGDREGGSRHVERKEAESRRNEARLLLENRKRGSKHTEPVEGGTRHKEPKENKKVRSRHKENKEAQEAQYEEHYTRCVDMPQPSQEFVPVPRSASPYSNRAPGLVSDYVNQPAAKEVTQSTPITPAYMVPIGTTSSAPTVHTTPGYVTITRLGDSKTTTTSLPAPTKGYITIADLAQERFPSHLLACKLN